MPQAAMLYARPSRAMLQQVSNLKFQCRKRQCYTRDIVPNLQHPFLSEVSMPQAAMLYARHEPNVDTKVVAIVSMPQAAMLYARLLIVLLTVCLFAFQCRKRQCYTRDCYDVQTTGVITHGVSMPQAAMLYARLCLSRPA